MRRFLVLFLSSVFLISYADPDEIVLTPDGPGKNRSDTTTFFDLPNAFYSTDLQEIIIDGGGAVSYYDVEISSPVTNYVEISTQVDGTYDTIDITSLPPGTHVITIESPSGNIYEGTFTSY